MRRMAVPLAALATLVAASAVAGRFLPPGQAFRFGARAAPGAVVLDWHIADGYYLYKSRFKFEAERGVIGAPVFPTGQIEHDPNFGKVTIYRGRLRLKVPVTRVSADGRVAFAVTYQGCADAGLCYAPITRHVSLAMPSAGPPGLSAAGGGGIGSASEQGRLAGLIEHANPAWFALVFFALGLLLAFTPCVLPMVPILAGVLGGARGAGTRRGFALSSVYVLAMAAVYTAAGVAAGFAGTGLQAFFQAPWVIALFAAIFVALALSLFGFYELRLPAALTERLSRASGRGRGWGGAAFMGALSALIVSPCIAAPLAGALVVIGQGGEPVRGGIALAALALGMGAPLVVYGTVAGRLLPKAGRWMSLIERLLGIVMLAYAVWLLGRVIPAPATLVLWGVTGLVAAVLLGLFSRRYFTAATGRRLARGTGLAAGVCGVILIVGGAAGSGDPLAPFAAFRAPQNGAALVWRPVRSVAGLEAQLAQAAAAGRPVMLDFYADWCTSCLEMDHTTFRAPAVVAALRRMRLLRADVTANTPVERALLKRFGLYGPPAYLFFDRCGRRLAAQDVVGYLGAERFLSHVRATLDEKQADFTACASESAQGGRTGVLTDDGLRLDSTS